MKKIHRLSGTCAVFALSHVSGIVESKVLEICKSRGFEWGEGMQDDAWIAAAKDLGIRRREMNLEKCKLREFLKRYPSGMFLVGTHNHIFSVNNGAIMVRPSTEAPDLRVIIHKAWRVYK